MLRINDLKNFIEISNFKSLKQTATKLEITQPALSDSLKRLETDLGCLLFYRTKNGVSLTPAGRKLLEKSKIIWNSINELQAKNELITNVTLGCHSVVGSYFLPNMLNSIGELHPNNKIQLKHGLSREIQEEIQQGTIDVGVVVNAIQNPDLVIRNIAQDNVCIWRSKKLTPKDQLICDPGLFQSSSLIKKWKNCPLKLLPSSSLELIGRLTESGVGYGILPERVVKIFNFNLVKVPNSPSYKDEFSIVHRPEFGKSKFEKDIITEIKSSF